MTIVMFLTTVVATLMVALVTGFLLPNIEKQVYASAMFIILMLILAFI